jgi:hypothetical protein
VCHITYLKEKFRVENTLVNTILKWIVGMQLELALDVPDADFIIAIINFRIIYSFTQKCEFV